MKEWILNNTNILEEDYDRIFNPRTVIMNGHAEENESDSLSNHPIVNIATFTFDYPTYFRRKKFKIKRLKDINKKNLYLYENIKFYILGEQFPLFANETYSSQRLKKCFYINSEICLSLKSNTYLITAMCSNPFRKSRNQYIHTFVLLKSNDGNDYIIDGTTNTIMNKKTYFDIFKPKIISCISKEKLQEDLKLLKPFEEQELIYRPEYLCFSKKTIRAVKKLNRKKQKLPNW